MQQRIAKRVTDRARQVLAPLGQWPRCSRWVPVSRIAAKLAAELPGDLRDYEVDHVLPLAGFDLRDDEQVAKAFSVENHQWLSRGANRRKGARR